jgi:uncharacterized membrane protein
MEKVYGFWRDFENLPKIMPNLVHVSEETQEKSRWVFRSRSGKKREWESKIIHEKQNQVIAWKTLRGSQVPHAGTVRFESGPLPGETEVTIQMEYKGRARAEKWFATLSGRNPGEESEECLRRFKALLETGEIPTIDGQPQGGGKERKRR